MDDRNKNIRVLIITDVRLYRDGLEHLLAANSRLQAIVTVSQPDEVLHQFRALNPSVVLLDPAMNDSRSIARTISKLEPKLPIIAFAVPDKSNNAIACAEAGFAGYILRDATVDELIAGIERAMSGELLCSPRVAGMLYRQISKMSQRYTMKNPHPLTRRETEILGLVNNGLSNKEIANRLRLSSSTIKNHVHNILEKLGVHRRGEAAAHLRTKLSRPYWS